MAADVVIDGLGGDDQAVGDLGVAQVLGQQGEHLQLACRSVRPRRRSVLKPPAPTLVYPWAGH